MVPLDAVPLPCGAVPCGCAVVLCCVAVLWCCAVWRRRCEGVLAQPDHNALGWCRDFLLDDGATGRGSCCTKDDDLAAWCGLVRPRVCVSGSEERS